MLTYVATVMSTVTQCIRNDGSGSPTTQVCLNIVIIVIMFVCLFVVVVVISCHTPSLHAISPLEPAVIPTAQASSFTLQYFPYYVRCSKYT